LSLKTTQVRCPSCNAAQGVRERGAYVCEYCMTQFTVENAIAEQARLLEEIKTWVGQRIGSQNMVGGVDSSSRSFIFREKLFPDLRREVERSLEPFGGAFADVSIPTPVERIMRPDDRPKFVNNRQSALALKGLRVKVANEDVLSFATNENERAGLFELDHQITGLINLSNALEALHEQDREMAYVVARRNLETMAKLLREKLGEALPSPDRRKFFAAALAYYQRLCEFCRISEGLYTCSPIQAEQTRLRLKELITKMTTAGQELEACEYNALEALDMASSLQKQTESSQTLDRWLGQFELLAQCWDGGFVPWVECLRPYCHAPSPAEEADLMEAGVALLLALRGDRPVLLNQDGAWISDWFESKRKKRTFGIFGDEERVADRQDFLLPVWIAKVRHASAQVGMFVSKGVESQGYFLISACSFKLEDVVLIENVANRFIERLSEGQSLKGCAVAMPRLSAGRAYALFQKAARLRPQLTTPRVESPQLAFFSAAWAFLKSPKGRREVAVCMDGALPAAPDVVHHLAWSRQFMERFSG